jgi:RecJ-like exonuclease
MSVQIITLPYGGNVMSCTKRPPKAWNGGSREEALKIAQERMEQAVAGGARRCAPCQGDGILNPTTVCPDCGGSGYFP